MLFQVEKTEAHAFVSPTASTEPVMTTTWASVHCWHLINLCSLDAVTVGLAWQAVFTMQFCNRYPTWAESLIIGLSIWLAYTVDRILDSRRLQTDKPHTFRHKFHHQFRQQLSIIWILALAIDATLIILFADGAQLQWGLGCLTLVILYIAGIQLGHWKLRLPKEIQAGFLFAFGITLTCWATLAEPSIYPLLLSTILVGFLFSINCATFAYWERRFDAAQSFSSWTSRQPVSLQPVFFALLLEVALTVALLNWALIPPFIAACLLASILCLAGVLLTGTRIGLQKVAENQLPASEDMPATLPELRVLFTDLSLFFPPTVFIVVATCNG